MADNTPARIRRAEPRADRDRTDDTAGSIGPLDADGGR